MIVLVNTMTDMKRIFNLINKGRYLPTKLHRIKPIVSTTLCYKARHQANVIANRFIKDCNTISYNMKPINFTYLISCPYKHERKRLQYVLMIKYMLRTFVDDTTIVDFISDNNHYIIAGS